MEDLRGEVFINAKGVLRVYVAECCYFCNETSKVVEKVRQEIPDLEIEVIDIYAEEEKVPDSVFSVPTYTFDGKTISLGNPSTDFLDKLRNLISAT